MRDIWNLKAREPRRGRARMPTKPKGAGVFRRHKKGLIVYEETNEKPHTMAHEKDCINRTHGVG